MAIVLFPRPIFTRHSVPLCDVTTSMAPLRGSMLVIQDSGLGHLLRGNLTLRYAIINPLKGNCHLTSVFQGPKFAPDINIRPPNVAIQKRSFDARFYKKAPIVYCFLSRSVPPLFILCVKLLLLIDNRSHPLTGQDLICQLRRLSRHFRFETTKFAI
jgi:hypothetical protein